MGSEFQDLMSDANPVIDDSFAEPLTLTRGAVVVEFEGILDLTGFANKPPPADVEIESIKPTLDVVVANIPTLGRPVHEDIVTNAAGRNFEIVKVLDGTEGRVVCDLNETTV